MRGAIAVARSLPLRACRPYSATAAASTHRLLRRIDTSAEPLPYHALHVRSMGQRPNESLEEELQRLAGYAQTSVSLKATLDTGLGLLLPESEGGSMDKKQHVLIQIASFLRREMPVRLARRVVELHNLPEGLHSMPSVVRVREWYEQSFVEIRRSQQPVDAATEQARAHMPRSLSTRAVACIARQARIAVHSCCSSVRGGSLHAHRVSS